MIPRNDPKPSCKATGHGWSACPRTQPFQPQDRIQDRRKEPAKPVQLLCTQIQYELKKHFFHHLPICPCRYESHLKRNPCAQKLKVKVNHSFSEPADFNFHIHYLACDQWVSKSRITVKSMHYILIFIFSLKRDLLPWCTNHKIKVGNSNFWCICHTNQTQEVL